MKNVINRRINKIQRGAPVQASDPEMHTVTQLSVSQHALPGHLLCSKYLTGAEVPEIWFPGTVVTKTKKGA